jgi:hypothetical protein
LLFRQPNYFTCDIAVSKQDPDVQVAKRANAGETVGEFSSPGRPFMLWLINVLWRGERTCLSRNSLEVRYVDNQQLGAAALRNLCGRLQRRASGRCTIMRHQDVMKVPGN